jgi:hypothetical protein
MRNWPVMCSRPISGLLVGLALTLLVSGCGGASPETRARQTRTALPSTQTPTALEASRTPLARATVAAMERDRAAMRTAEASLPIATRGPPHAAIIITGTVAGTREGQ